MKKIISPEKKTFCKGLKYLPFGLLLIAALLVAGSVCFFSREIDYASGEEASSEIVMVLPTYGYVPDEMETILEEMNKISSAKYGIAVRYIFSNVEDLAADCELRLAAGEQIDLMPCMDGDLLRQYISQGIAAPLNDLLQESGAEILENYPSRLWEALEWDGTIYAVSSLNVPATQEGLVIRKDVLDAIGVTAEEVLSGWNTADAHSVQEWDDLLTPLFEKIKNCTAILEDGQKVSEMTLAPGFSGYGGIFSQCHMISYEGFGNTLGCVLDENPVVENLYRTEEYLDMLELIRKWQVKGYIHNIDSQTKENAAILYESGVCFGTFTETSQESASRFTRQSGYETECISLVDCPLTTELMDVGNWIIPASSKNQAEAMGILSLMFTDPDYVTLYIYGIDGVHYNTDSSQNGILDSDYTQSLTWIFGNTLLPSAGEDGTAQMMEIYENCRYSSFWGFRFEDEEYDSKIQAMEKILQRYLPELECGKIQNPGYALSRMNQELYENGLKEVMEEKQAQLDSWIESQNF